MPPQMADHPVASGYPLGTKQFKQVITTCADIWTKASNQGTQQQVMDYIARKFEVIHAAEVPTLNA